MESTSGGRHPFFSLLMLMIWAFIGITVFTALGMGVCALIYGISFFSDLSQNAVDVNSLKIIQFFSATGTFIFPAILFARKESTNPWNYFRLNTALKFDLLIVSIIIFFAFVPFLEWTIVWNEGMKLPSFLSEVEAWMKDKENELATMTKQLLVMKSLTDLVVNLLVIAVLAGISEELFFRGCLQQLLIKWTNHYHLGIWIAAIIFSVIHVQFYGFIPRMLLGALFGYLFYFGKNLLIPMLAHMINNGIAVIGAYQLQQKGQSLDQLDHQMSFPVFSVYLSVIIGVFLLLVYKRLAEKKEVSDEQRLD